jgi:hypothetical protein
VEIVKRTYTLRRQHLRLRTEFREIAGSIRATIALRGKPYLIAAQLKERDFLNHRSEVRVFPP